jgi:uncharacterized damage-inducible protein DinB
MEYQHKSLVEIIDGLSEEQIRINIIPGKWSIFENIVHLQTYQHVFCDRFKKIMQNSKPVFERYTAEADPDFLDNCHRTIREIMQDFISMRKQMVASALSLNEKDFGKSGFHPVYGQLNMVQWLNFFLLHEAHHLFTIFKLASLLSKEKVPGSK